MKGNPRKVGDGPKYSAKVPQIGWTGDKHDDVIGADGKDPSRIPEEHSFLRLMQQPLEEFPEKGRGETG